MTSYKAWAEKAYPILHPAYKATKNYGVPEDWFAGLVAVECASLHPKARRFENGFYKDPARPGGVFAEVLTVRNGKVSKDFPGFNTGKLKAYITNPHTTITDLADLATSFGFGQIMGYHYFSKWGLLPEQFSNLGVQDSTTYTLRMMAEGMGWANKYLKTQESPDWSRNFEYLMRWWNTGRVLGHTYDPDYVANATAARNAYREVLHDRGSV